MQDDNICNGITSIGTAAFSSYTNLKYVSIPDSVTSIGERAFYGCTGLTELTIPGSVTDIGANAFWSCSGLKSLICPGDLDYSNHSEGLYSVFSGCTGLEKAKLTGNGEIPEYYAYNLYYYRYTPWYISSAAGTKVTLEIEEGITGIGAYAFAGCSNISKIYLPFSINDISSNAFNQCTGLSDVYFNGSEKEANGILIGNNNNALSSATWRYSLPNPDKELTLKLPGQLKSIDEEAFAGSTAEVIVIPSSVETIKSKAFVNCANLKAIIFEGTPMSIANDMVSNPEDVTVYAIKESFLKEWAHEAGFKVKYNLGEFTQ